MPTITVDQISKIIERCCKDQELDKPVIDHVIIIVNRHVDACKIYDVAPEITRTVIEAVEDYCLKEATGISVIDRPTRPSLVPSDKFSSIPLPSRKPHTEAGRMRLVE